MPTSEAGRTTRRFSIQQRPVLRRISGRRGAGGFTLLEIMVVIVVIGVLVSIFSLSVGGFVEDRGAEDMRRLEALIALASEEASIQGREIGLSFYQHGYEFSQRETFTDDKGVRYHEWLPLQDDRMFRARNLGDDLTVDLDLDGEEITLLYERDSEEDYEPQIFLLSSGDIEPPFSARIRPSFESEGFLIMATTDGKLEVRVEGVDDTG